MEKSNFIFELWLTMLLEVLNIQGMKILLQLEFPFLCKK